MDAVNGPAIRSWRFEFLAAGVRRYTPLICYQAAAITMLSACGVVVGTWAGMPLWFVGGDAAACWAYGVPMLGLAGRVERGRAEKGASPDRGSG